MDVVSELQANVWKVTVALNETVEEGQTLCILESMKMEIPVESPVSGTVTALDIAEGDAVADGQRLARVE